MNSERGTLNGENEKVSDIIYGERGTLREKYENTLCGTDYV